jgi:hypothetical protein
MRPEAEREAGPIRFEQESNEQPKNRQIAPPTQVHPQLWMDWNNPKWRTASFDKQFARKSEPNTFFATSEAELQNRNPECSHPVGSRQDGWYQQPDANGSDSVSDLFGALNPFDINGANGTFVETVVNPENDRLAAAYGQFHQLLAKSKVVDWTSNAGSNDSDATRDLPAEFFPAEVVSGPSGVWDTSKLARDRQITVTMVNPLDECRKKA